MDSTREASASGPEPELSVVIPAFNAAGTLRDQLDALVRQEDPPDLEILVCDNGSTDDTAAMTRRYAEVFPTIRLIPAAERKGASYARNRGAEFARSRHLAFCDADDVVAPRWARAIHDALATHDLVCGPLLYDLLNPAWVADLRLDGQSSGPLYMAGGPAWPFCLSANIGVRRETHVSGGGFDETLPWGGEDVDYCWRLQYGGATLHFSPDAVVQYRCRSGLRTYFRQTRAYSRAHRDLYTRWHPVWPAFGSLLTYRDWRRLGLRRLWWIRSRRGLGAWVREQGWAAGRVCDDGHTPIQLGPMPGPGGPGDLDRGTR